MKVAHRGLTVWGLADLVIEIDVDGRIKGVGEQLWEHGRYAI